MNHTKILFVFILFFLSATTAQALSVSPAGTTIEGEAGETRSFTFSVSSQENKSFDIRVKDRYDELIDVDERSYNLSDNTVEISGEATISDDEYLRIEVVERSTGEGQVNTRPSIPFYIYMDGKLQGKHVDYRWRYTHEDHQREGEAVVNIQNSGTQDIDELSVSLEGQTFSRTSTLSSLPSESIETIRLQTPNQEPGEKTYTYSIRFDDKQRNGTLNVEVGEPDIHVENANIDGYTENQNNILQLVLGTHWNEAINQDLTVAFEGQNETFLEIPKESVSLNSSINIVYNDSKLPRGETQIIVSGPTDSETITYVKEDGSLTIKDEETVLFTHKAESSFIYLYLAGLILILILIYHNRYLLRENE